MCVCERERERERESLWVHIIGVHVVIHLCSMLHLWLLQRLTAVCAHVQKGNTNHSRALNVNIKALWSVSVCPSADRALQCKCFLHILKANRLVCMCAKPLRFPVAPNCFYLLKRYQKWIFLEPFNPKLLFLRLSSCLQASASLCSPAVVLAQVVKSCIAGLRVGWFTFQSRLSFWLRVSLPSAGALELQVVWCLQAPIDWSIWCFSMCWSQRATSRSCSIYLSLPLDVGLWFV